MNFGPHPQNKILVPFRGVFKFSDYVTRHFPGRGWGKRGGSILVFIMAGCNRSPEFQNCLVAKETILSRYVRQVWKLSCVVVVVVIVAGYFLHLGMLNQLLTLSHQLNSDAFNLTNHKYMAHQTALLYVRYSPLFSTSLLYFLAVFIKGAMSC